jgi:hypothetical protein
MGGRLSYIVILALAAALSLTGCAAKAPDTAPMASVHETGAAQTGGESARPGPETVTVTEAAFGTAPSSPEPENVSTPPASMPSPFPSASVPLQAPQASENRRIPSRVPILYYHSISDQPVGIRELSVATKDFEAQMRYLAKNGYTAIDFAELDHFTSFEKPVIITLDDGYADNYTNAYPVLKNTA